MHRLTLLGAAAGFAVAVLLLYTPREPPPPAPTHAPAAPVQLKPLPFRPLHHVPAFDAGQP